MKLYVLVVFMMWAATASGQAQPEVGINGVISPHRIKLEESDGTPAHLGQMLAVMDYGDGDSLLGFVPLYYVNDSTVILGADTLALKSDISTTPALPAGSVNNSLRHNGTGWESSSVLEILSDRINVNSGSNNLFINSTPGVVTSGFHTSIIGGAPMELTGSYTFLSGLQNFHNIATSYNFGAGYRNFYDNTTGSYNFGAGRENFRNNTTGSYNFGSGFNNFYTSTSANYCFSSGRENFRNNTTGSVNFGAGQWNFRNNTTGSYNFGSGLNNFYRNTTGSRNYGTGYRNFYNNTEGTNNFGVGTDNFYNNTDGSNNFGVGTNNFNRLTTGNYNLAIGAYNLQFIVSGTNNTLFGSNNFNDSSVKSAEDVTAFGNSIGRSVTTDTSATNIFVVGDNALRNASRLDNITAIGYRSGYNNAYDKVVLLGDNSEATKRAQVVIGSGDYDELLVGVNSKAVFDLGGSPTEISDGLIRVNGNEDTKTLEYQGTKLSIGALNSKAYSANNTALLNVGSNADGSTLFRLWSNNNTGYVTSTQRNVSALDLQVTAAGVLVHDFQTDGDAVHSGSLFVETVDSQTTVVTKLLTLEGAELKFTDPTNVGGSSEWADITGKPAGFADGVDDVDDADADASNELQVFDVSQLSGTNLELSLSSDGEATKVIDLSSLQDGTGTDDQTLSIVSNSLSIENGNSVDLSGYLDNTDDQTLSIVSNSLSIENGNSVDLSGYLDNTDDQTLSFASPNLSISGGNSVDLSAIDTDTKLNINSGDSYIPQRANSSGFVNSKLRTVSTYTVFENADHPVRIEDGQIRPNTGADTDTLTIRATKLNVAKLNSQTDNAQNDAIFNVLGNANSDKLAGFDSNSGTGEVSITQLSNTTVDLQITAAGVLVHDFQPDGDAVHSGNIAAVDATLSGDVSAVGGTFTGNVSTTGSVSAATASITSGVIQTPLEVEGSFHGFGVIQAPNVSGNAGLKLENTADDNDSWMLRRDAGGSFKIGYSSAQPYGSETEVVTAEAEKVQFHTNVIQIENINVTTAGALTPTDGMIIYVTNTDATFTSVGFWGRENGAWVKL